MFKIPGFNQRNVLKVNKVDLIGSIHEKELMKDQLRSDTALAEFLSSTEPHEGHKKEELRGANKLFNKLYKKCSSQKLSTDFSVSIYKRKKNLVAQEEVLPSNKSRMSYPSSSYSSGTSSSKVASNMRGLRLSVLSDHLRDSGIYSEIISDSENSIKTTTKPKYITINDLQFPNPPDTLKRIEKDTIKRNHIGQIHAEVEVNNMDGKRMSGRCHCCEKNESKSMKYSDDIEEDKEILLLLHIIDKLKYQLLKKREQ
ncbi:hypothetical protein BDB01DRAFT_782028 [Pilobolus umbonatus]|nr:hypothetical protein BDB01DRAFT_782028 [Pilobolus umbonatus]